MMILSQFGTNIRVRFQEKEGSMHGSLFNTVDLTNVAF